MDREVIFFFSMLKYHFNNTASVRFHMAVPVQSCSYSFFSLSHTHVGGLLGYRNFSSLRTFFPNVHLNNFHSLDIFPPHPQRGNGKGLINLKIRIKIESLLNPHQIFFRCSKPNVSSQSSQAFLPQRGNFTLKKSFLLTTLSSPHVHKKSREQYKFTYYKIYYTYSIHNFSDFKHFLHFKNNLYDFYLHQGYSQSITCTYIKTFNLHGFLP